MPTVTYDPILELRELPRLRIFTPIAAPRLGTSLVLEPEEGPPLVIAAGDRVPEARLGKYHRSYLIDLGNYALSLEERVPSADPSFQFTATVSFTCRVHNPTEIAKRRVRDMTGSLRLQMARLMRQAAREYDISEFNQAEAAMNAHLAKFTGDSAVYLGGYLVELHAGGAVEQSSAEFHDTSRAIRMDRMRREPMADVVRGGRDEMYAQWLAKRGGDPSQLLEFEATARADEAELMLRTMKALEPGEGGEPFAFREERKKLTARLLGEPSEDRPKKRKSRLTGSLAPASDSASEEQVRSQSDRPEAGEPGQPVNRIRGLGQGPGRTDPDG
ncbi:hypothetical protein [Amycolatopsis sp. NPDC052450]|uniref:hypothetical protein n=1 Tax=Amycolatopsis sp. NPDC052450 TaxID=3363937 RepID=UPI0037C887E0